MVYQKSLNLQQKQNNQPCANWSGFKYLPDILRRSDLQAIFNDQAIIIPSIESRQNENSPNHPQLTNINQIQHQQKEKNETKDEARCTPERKCEKQREKSNHQLERSDQKEIKHKSTDQNKIQGCPEELENKDQEEIGGLSMQPKYQDKKETKDSGEELESKREEKSQDQSSVLEIESILDKSERSNCESESFNVSKDLEQNKKEDEQLFMESWWSSSSEFVTVFFKHEDSILIPSESKCFIEDNHLKFSNLSSEQKPYESTFWTIPFSNISQVTYHPFSSKIQIKALQGKGCTLTKVNSILEQLITNIQSYGFDKVVRSSDPLSDDMPEQECQYPITPAEVKNIQNQSDKPPRKQMSDILPQNVSKPQQFLSQIRATKQKPQREKSKINTNSTQCMSMIVWEEKEKDQRSNVEIPEVSSEKEQSAESEEGCLSLLSEIQSMEDEIEDSQSERSKISMGNLSDCDEVEIYSSAVLNGESKETDCGIYLDLSQEMALIFPTERKVEINIMDEKQIQQIYAQSASQQFLEQSLSQQHISQQLQSLKDKLRSVQSSLAELQEMLFQSVKDIIQNLKKPEDPKEKTTIADKHQKEEGHSPQRRELFEIFWDQIILQNIIYKKREQSEFEGLDDQQPYNEKNCGHQSLILTIPSKYRKKYIIIKVLVQFRFKEIDPQGLNMFQTEMQQYYLLSKGISRYSVSFDQTQEREQQHAFEVSDLTKYG